MCANRSWPSIFSVRARCRGSQQFDACQNVVGKCSVPYSQRWPPCSPRGVCARACVLFTLRRRVLATTPGQFKYRVTVGRRMRRRRIEGRGAKKLEADQKLTKEKESMPGADGTGIGHGRRGRSDAGGGEERKKQTRFTWKLVNK